MATKRASLASGTAILLLVSMGTLVGTARAQSTDSETAGDGYLGTLVISAEDQIKQALGASTVTGEDLEKQPVVNDIADIIRKQPGVNLTGNSASGQRGNQRQIDIRGMGPENVLILVDGRPVTSRNAARMGRQGERDTRGDSNWVPAELVERIEVIRGPAAARYGSGAAGGVVNIITKKQLAEPTAQVSLHFDAPESDKEGVTRRANVLFAGPLNDRLSYRLYANVNKTDGDDPDINEGEAAGSEGVTNRDLGALLSWQLNAQNTLDFELTHSRQTNLFAGETGFGSGVTEEIGDDTTGTFSPVGEETRRDTRTVLAVTHTGDYDFGSSQSYLQYERTLNSALCQGTSGGGEGTLSYCVDSDGDGTNDDVAWIDTDYDALSGKTQWDLYGSLMGAETTYTLGAELRAERINQDIPDALLAASPTRDEFKDEDAKRQTIWGVYSEANILVNDRLTLTPGLRYDRSDKFGGNWSPSLNATYDFDDEWSMKVGVARAFKAPNLFQLNPDYYYNTMGMGCPDGFSGPCRIQGNADLDPEISINKEIGVAYNGLSGRSFSLTYFHNDYRDRIAADVVGGEVDPSTGGSVFQWANVPEAVVAGWEGNFYTPIAEDFAFNMNFTVMTESENKQTGNPLSLVPDYTVNAALDWQATDDLLLRLSATHYGTIPTITTTLSTNVEVTDEADLTERDPYTLVDLSAKWDLGNDSHISAGVTNLFDTSIERTGNGSETFNEPGRAYFIGLTKTF
ncbi:MAG: FepA family TonB-dependent siderophore receptor [Salipiger marinus]|uniref:FepA family TonB-dependent siderophore receptor n=1 Tax=Salipiger marinus TaxID=555512 RepID=UPI004057CCE2